MNLFSIIFYLLLFVLEFKVIKINMTSQNTHNEFFIPSKNTQKFYSFSNEKYKAKFPTLMKVNHLNPFITNIRSDYYKEVVLRSYIEKYKKETTSKKPKLPKLNPMTSFTNTKKLSKIFLQLNNNSNYQKRNFHFTKVNALNNNCNGLSLSFSNTIIRKSMNRSLSSMSFFRS